MTTFLKNRHFLSLTGNGVMAVFSLLTYFILYRFMAAADMGNWVSSSSYFCCSTPFGPVYCKPR